jgi:hypothetical protein
MLSEIIEDIECLRLAHKVQNQKPLLTICMNKVAWDQCVLEATDAIDRDFTKPGRGITIMGVPVYIDLHQQQGYRIVER